VSKSHSHDKMRVVTPLKLAGTALYIAFWPTLMFLVAGDGRWLEGWLSQAGM
jgi:hypothetical protein